MRPCLREEQTRVEEKKDLLRRGREVIPNKSEETAVVVVFGEHMC